MIQYIQPNNTNAELHEWICAMGIFFCIFPYLISVESNVLSFENLYSKYGLYPLQNGC